MVKQSKSTVATKDKLNFPTVELSVLISSDLMSSGDLNYGIMLIIKESYWMSQDNLMEFKFLLFASENISLCLTSVDSADSQFDVCLSH